MVPNGGRGGWWRWCNLCLISGETSCKWVRGTSGEAAAARQGRSPFFRSFLCSKHATECSAVDISTGCEKACCPLIPWSATIKQGWGRDNSVYPTEGGRKGACASVLRAGKGKGLGRRCSLTTSKQLNGILSWPHNTVGPFKAGNPRVWFLLMAWFPGLGE